MMVFSLEEFSKALKKYKGSHLPPTLLFRKEYISNRRKCRFPVDSSYCFQGGGRFNFPRKIPILYLGFSEISATLEISDKTNPLCTILQPTDYRGSISFPIIVSGDFVDLEDPVFGFDKTNPEYMIDTKEWMNAILNKTEAITHKIGKIAYDQGFDGIIYHSYQAFKRNFQGSIPAETKCLAVFMSAKDFISPKNPGCSVVCLDATLHEQLIPPASEKK